MQVNLAEAHARERTLDAMGLQDGDILHVPPPAMPAPPTSTWAVFKEGLVVTTQILTVFGAMLSTYFTYSVLHDQGKL
jgi:hypothetical protein